MSLADNFLVVAELNQVFAILERANISISLVFKRQTVKNALLIAGFLLPFEFLLLDLVNPLDDLESTRNELGPSTFLPDDTEVGSILIKHNSVD